MKKSRVKGNVLFYQSSIACLLGIILIIVALFMVNPEERGNILYNPIAIEGLVLYTGLFLGFAGLIIAVVSYLFGPLKPKDDKKE